MLKIYRYKSVSARVSFGCYKGEGKLFLQGCHKAVTRALQGRHKGVIRVLQGWYKSVMGRDLAVGVMSALLERYVSVMSVLVALG